MKHRYLEITFRNGKPLAAYLYLPRSVGAKAVRTLDADHGLHVDFDEQDTPIGVEIVSPRTTTISDVNAVLVQLGLDAVEPAEWAPLAAERDGGAIPRPALSERALRLVEQGTENPRVGRPSSWGRLTCLQARKRPPPL